MTFLPNFCPLIILYYIILYYIILYYIILYYILLYFPLKVSKNYFSQVYGHIFGQNVINGVNLVNIGQVGKNGHNWVILAYFVGQNDIKCQNWGEVVK